MPINWKMLRILGKSIEYDVFQLQSPKERGEHTYENSKKLFEIITMWMI